jgi:GTP-binding protein
MFVDRVRIRVTAGAGGNGCVSFRREKYVPKGGPDGGDGGKGGDIIAVATSRVNALNHLRYHSTWVGKRGAHGMGSDMHGRNAEDAIIDVPIGTLIRDDEDGTLLADLTEEGDRFVVAAGGRGGKGNARFTTSTERAPRFAEKGEPGEEAHLLLELKVIADVGLVGLPNAGKSTLLSRITAAQPKIGDYPFTTLAPNLGVVELSDFRTFTVADIPGIIEGAAEGKGLGHEFLRHIERTKVLLFLIDPTEDDPRETYETLRNELTEHSEAFASRRSLVAFSKADLPDAQAAYELYRNDFAGLFVISGVTGEGVDALLEALWKEIERARADDAGMESEPVGRVEYAYQAPFTIEETQDGFEVQGKPVVRAVLMTDFENDDAVRYLDRRLKQMGLYKALQRMGAAEGHTIHIGGVELEYHED